MKTRSNLLLFVLIYSMFGVSNAGNGIGIVLLHGIGTQPHWSANSTLASELRSEGYDVLTPVFPWSGKKGKTSYDGSLQDSYDLITGSINDLRDQGNKHIFVSGHSVGAVVSLGYATKHSNIDGVIGIAPGFPGWSVPMNHSLDFKPKILKNMNKRANKKIDMGKGDVESEFVTNNHGKKFKIWTTPNNYLSFHHFEGVSRMDLTMPDLKVPVLWISTSQDVFTKNGLSRESYDLAPQDQMNRYVEISTQHNKVPRDSGQHIMTWVNRVIKTQ